MFFWIMGNAYAVFLWIITFDVFSISILFSILLGLVALGITVIQFILTKHLFRLLRKFIIMSKIKTPKPKQSETDTKPVRTPKPKPKYRDVENNR